MFDVTTEPRTDQPKPPRASGAAPVRDCPCCGSLQPFAEICRLLIAKPDAYPGDAELRIGVCPDCGMGYSEDGVTQASLDAFYASRAKYADLEIYGSNGAAGSLASEAPWELERSESLMRFAEPFVSKTEFILDVGCSTGTALVILRNDGYERLGGIDPLRASVDVAREARGLDVIEGRFGTHHSGGTPDVVVISHVLEHVLDVHQAIQATAESLAPGGRVVIEVPDATRFHDHVYAPYQDFNTEHINHFSLHHLGALMAGHGFVPLRLEEAMVRSGPHHVYPVVRGIWRVEPARPRVAVVHDGGALRQALEAYRERSEELFRHVDALVEQGIGDDQFVLWGAGQFAMKLIKRRAFPVDQCRGIVDSSPSRQGLRIDSFTVGRPQDLDSGAPAVLVPGSIFGAESIERAARDLGMAVRVVRLGD